MLPDRSSGVRRLVGVHVVLALVPVGIGLVAFNKYTMPIAWGLAAVSFAQIMLLAMWLGMTGWEKTLQRILTAILAVAFMSIWHAIAQVAQSPIRALPLIASAYARNFLVISILLMSIALVLFGASKLFGTIGLPLSADSSMPEPRYRFSLLALLVTATTISIILGLVRIAQAGKHPTGDVEPAVDYMLAAVIYGLNTLATVWATLGPGHVARRVSGVMVVSILLGLSLAAALANPAIVSEGWWLFVSRSVIVILPTIIVVLSLLYLRRHGFRLVPPTN